MTKEYDQVLSLIKKTVREKEPTADIILYGSRARGDARIDSDWDVIVIHDKPSLSFDERGDLDYILWTKGLEIGKENSGTTFLRRSLS